jgi:hypothetical protein
MTFQTRSEKDNQRRCMFTFDGAAVAVVRRPGLTTAGDKRLAVHALDADGIARALRLVGDDPQAGFVAADGLRLTVESGGGALELFAALNLNHGRFSLLFIPFDRVNINIRVRIKSREIFALV